MTSLDVCLAFKKTGAGEIAQAEKFIYFSQLDIQILVGDLKEFVCLGLAVGAALSLAACQTQANPNIATYSDLKARGLKTSRLGPNKENRSWGVGWYVSGGGERYWCAASSTTVRIGTDGFGVFAISTGKVYEVDEQRFANSLRRDTSDAPQLEDLKAGRPRPQDVNGCHKI